MLAFTVTLSMMCRTRQRLEAFIWVVCLSIGNFVVIGMIKTVLSGGGGNTVIGADGNILGERVVVRRRDHDHYPVDPVSARPPDDFPGFPNGRGAAWIS